MSDAFERLRASVKAWYWEEADRTASSFESAGDLAAVEFDELIRRAQVLFACEMAELCRQEDAPLVDPKSPDYAHLLRVAQAMQAAGKEVPETIRKILDGS